jgi:hypothetical protein
VCWAQYGELPGILGSPQNRAAGSRRSPRGQRHEHARSCRIGVPGILVGAFVKASVPSRAVCVFRGGVLTYANAMRT